MGKHINKFETFLTFVFIIFSLIGIVYSQINKVDKTPGELTIDNYTQFLTIDLDTRVDYNWGNTAVISYNLIAKTNFHEIDNLEITYIVTTPNGSLAKAKHTFYIVLKAKTSHTFSNNTINNVNIVDVDLSSDIFTLQIVSISGTYKIPKVV